jgi:hypothetical protein
MLQKLVIASALFVSTSALAQQPTPADPARLSAIIQQMKAQRDTANDQSAVISADLALANQKIAELTKQIATEKAKIGTAPGHTK